MVSKKEHQAHSHCPLALGLDIVGDHWTLLIVRDLLFGKHEFKEFLESDEGISSNILSDRLARLQAQTVVQWIHHPQSKTRNLYYLTGKGKELIHVVVPLVRWSLKHRQGEVQIPAQRAAALQQGPEQFIRSTLQALAEWESAHGIDAMGTHTRL